MYRLRSLCVFLSISLGLFLACVATPAEAQNVQYTALGGSSAGSSFSDTNCEKPVEVRVQAGHWIDGIRLVCADSRGNLKALNVRGGTGGGSYTFRLQEGEEIRRITGTAIGSVGPYVYALQIHTNRRSSPRYGEGGSVRGQRSFDLRVPDGHQFVGLGGFAGQYLNGIKIAHRRAGNPRAVDRRAGSTRPQRPVSVRLSFVNRSQSVLQTFWVPEQGQERKYATIQARASANQQTYSGHVWRVKERSTGKVVKTYTATRQNTQQVVVTASEVAAVLPRPVADNRPSPRATTPSPRTNTPQPPRVVRTETGSVVREEASQVVRDAAGNAVQNAVEDVRSGVAGTNVTVVDPFANAQTCWRESYGRGVGTIPTSCGSDENDAGLCYSRCRSGYRSAGPMCWKACPSGFTEVGPLCMKGGSYTRASYPWKFGDGLNLSGARKRCERKHGRGKCVKIGELMYPRCRSGYRQASALTPYVCAPQCPSGFRDNGVGGCERPSYGRGVGTVPSTCGRGQENDGGLCYSGCRSGYNGIGPVCWANQCPAEFPTQCGAGCAKSTQACVESITTQVESSLEMVQSITGIVATGGASTAVMQVPKATIKRQVKRKAQEVGKNLTEAAAENAAMVFFDAQLTGEFSWADLDPTGITNVVAAFYKPLCEDFD